MCDKDSLAYLPELAHLDEFSAYRRLEKLVDENLVLRKRNKCQEEIIVELKNEINILKKQVAALSKNSSTSSKPPSSDIIKGEKKKKGRKDRSKRRGAQKGHKKHERKAFSPDEIDNWNLYTLNGCPDCGSQIELCPEKTKVIQQVEINEVPITITEHRGVGYWCKKCHKFHYSNIPDDVMKAGLCGPSFTALIGYMKSSMHCSFSTIRKYVRDVLKITLSRGQLSKLLDKVGCALEAPYEELLKRLSLEGKLNIDETGHKDNGDKFWTWCFRAELYVLFKIDKSRGSKVLIDVLGEEFDGLIGCDYFSAYRKFMKDFNITIQFCIAHLIRDVRFLCTLPDKDEKAYGEKLLAKIRKMFTLIRDNVDNPRELITEELKEIQNGILQIGIEEVPLKYDKNGKPIKSKSRNIANRFKKHGESFFQFITSPEIDPTNNIAEQAIRFVVIDRYITQGTRSEKGRRNCERLWTVFATCQLQGRSTFQFIKTAVQAYMNRGSPPSLLEPALAF